MELNIIKKEEKPLLSRTEVVAEIDFDASTPKKEEIKKKIASSLKSDPNITVIKKVYTIFGKKKIKVLAFVYKSEKDMKRIEPKPKVKKTPKEEKAKVEKKESKEEKPKEKEGQ